MASSCSYSWLRACACPRRAALIVLLSLCSSSAAADGTRWSSSAETESHNLSTTAAHHLNLSRFSALENPPPNLTRADVKIGGKCDIFSGTWVLDLGYPQYDWRSCPFLDGEVSCQKNGRPDLDYQKWKWKPRDCDLPRFDGLYMLERMRGKSIMFVGDSLNRGQWESMMCLVHSVLPQSRISYTPGDPISTFKALDYGVSLSFYRAPYLVDMESSVVQGQKKVVLRLDSIAMNGRGWKGMDVLVFNSGHWWTHTGALQGWDYMQEGNRFYKDMDRTLAYQKGMTTWANWIDSNIDTRKTRVFFRSYSPSHTSAREWNNQQGNNCFGEREPIAGFWYPGPYPPLYKAAESIVGRMKSAVHFLDITTLSLLRKDGHPSIYSSDFTVGQRKNPDRYADCSHWCLPGVPDTWNQLLYYALLF